MLSVGTLRAKVFGKYLKSIHSWENSMILFTCFGNRTGNKGYLVSITSFQCWMEHDGMLLWTPSVSSQLHRYLSQVNHLFPVLCLALSRRVSFRYKINESKLEPWTGLKRVWVKIARKTNETIDFWKEHLLNKSTSS